MRKCYDSNILGAGTNKSGQIAAGGTAQELAAENTTRKGLTIQNISAENLGVNYIGGAAAIGSAGTFTLAAGATMDVWTNRAVSVIGATTGSKFTAVEW